MARILHNTLALYRGAAYSLGWKTEKVDKLLDESKRVIKLAEQPAQQEPVAWVTVEKGVCVSTRSANFKNVPDGQHQLYVGPLQNDVLAAISTLKSLGYVYNESKTCKEGEQWIAPQPAQQEPVAWTLTEELEKRETTTRAHLWFSDPVNCMWTPLYTSPPAQRKPLTTKEIREWWASENGLEDCAMSKLDDFEQVVRAVEAKHNIKENT